MKRNCITILIVFGLIIASMAFINTYIALSYDNKHYQLLMETDSVRIYQNSRTVSVVPYGRHGIDSVIILDSQ